MRIQLAPEFISLFPNAEIGLLIFQMSEPCRPKLEAIDRMRLEAESLLNSQNISLENLLELPNISVWRDAYRKFGVKPNKYKPTHEAFIRRILSGKGWPNINPIVDTYLISQVITILPHGGYDLKQVNGCITLGVSEGGEVFEPLGSETELTNQGEVIYWDESRVLTRRWNYRDSRYTAIQEDTKEFCLMIESPGSPILTGVVAQALRKLEEVIHEILNGVSKTTVLEVSRESFVELSI